MTIFENVHLVTLILDVVIGTDLSEIVDSICKDGGFPESPPDSGSEHLMSPASGSSLVNPGIVSSSLEDYYINHGPVNRPRNRDFNAQSMMPDLSKVNYSVPMQMIEDDYKVSLDFAREIQK